MNINEHPIWKNISPFKKPIHLARMHLARQFVKLFPKETFIGITGSVGKTTCVKAATLVLSQKYKTASTKSNLDPILNIPISLLKLNPTIKRLVLEMGIEYKGEMDFYLSIVQPKKAIITKIYYAHSEFLGGLDDIAYEKGRLVDQLPEDGVAILNGDDMYCRKIAQRCKGEVVFFGTDKKTCQVWAGNIKVENYRTFFELNYGVERVQIEYPLLGEHQVYPALAAAALGIVEGVSLAKIKKGLEQMEPSEHRLQVVEGPSGSVLLDDTYNASPIAVEAAIDTLMQIPGKRKIVVLGEMRELGDESDKMHRSIARKVYKEKPDYVLLGGGEANIIADELKKLGFSEDRLDANLQNSQIVSKLLKVLAKGDVCLIKGSRAVRLDEVVKRIAKK